ncbi:hypothetical protein [Marinicella meishanensis]|uniref:sulfotransferase-like domain-containing protein n=1 Tax=Marinicella meishanensis TaxID=2873263 RepID=UPI001CBB4CD8|nr:hypothetical protein [Marinicella sp. NBU2979]
MSDSLIRIAMWSGPRNISTAMLRAWENRPDTVVVDEPLYGPYLATTGKRHAAYETIMQVQGTDWRPIVKALTEAKPADADAGTQIFYQKHMSHHLTDDIELDFVGQLRHGFLLRHPNEVLASYLRKHPRATPADLGYPQQVRLYQWLREHTDQHPPVMLAKDILQDPKNMLSKLCAALGVPFDEAMLSWPKGYRESDGVWAEHWYNRVIESTGFAPYRPKENTLSHEEQAIADACLPYYEQLAEWAMR